MSESGLTIYTLYAILIAVLLSLPSFGQDASSMLKRSQQLTTSNLDSSSWYAIQAYRAALEERNPSLARQSQFLLGVNMQMQGDLSSAIDVFKQILTTPLTDAPPEEYVQAYGRIGDCYTDLGQFDSAVVYLVRFDQLVDQYWSLNKIDAKLLLGELYLAMGRMDQSDTYKIEAIRRARQGDNDTEKMIALYFYLDDHKKELDSELFQEYFAEYMELLAEQEDGNFKTSHVTMFFDDLSVSEKIELLQRGIERGKDAGYSTTILMYSQALIQIHLDNFDFKAALPHADQGLALARRISDQRFHADFNHYLFKIYEGLKNYGRAIYFLQQHHLIKDSLENILIQKNIDNLNIQYETAKNERRIADQELALQRSHNQRNMLLGGLALALWFGAFLGLYFWSKNRFTKRLALQDARIQQQKIEQLEQEKSLLAMSSMLEGQEAERKRIAQDLHDGLGGLLSSVKAQIEQVQRKVEQLENYDVYQKASGLIDQASQEVRRIARNMMPASLSRLGLQAAVEDLTSDLEQLHGLQVQTEILGLSRRFEETREIMLYRIIQELCNNIVKHADASQVLIQINATANEIFVVVEDNGKGFDQSEEVQGIGLASIRSRVKFLDGDLDIATSPDSGTSVTINVPG